MALMHVDFFSDVLGMCVNMDVIIPQQTKGQIGMEGRGGEGPYKTMYLLHGMSDDQTIWQRRTSIERYVSRLGIAVVMPTTHLAFYTDTTYGMRYWTFISQELPEICREFFPRMSREREDTLAAGLSMGGYGALLHGLENPERYRAIGAFSPAVFSQKQLEENPRGLRLKDLYAVTEKALAGRKVPDLFLCIGDKDFLYGPVTEYHDFLKRVWTGARLRYDDMPGYEHEFAIWDLEVSSFLDWIPREDVFKQMGPNKV